MTHLITRISPFSPRVVIAVLFVTCSATWMVLAQQTQPSTAPTTASGQPGQPCRSSPASTSRAE